MRNTGLDELQAGIKIGGRNVNNFQFVDDTTLMEESELKSLLMRVKEESERACLRINIKKKKPKKQKTKIMASGPVPLPHGE